MMRSLWIAKTGLDAQQTQLDISSNNLSNTSTNGFKRSRAVFEDLLYQTLRQPGADTAEGAQVPSGLQVGTGVKPVASVRNFSQGNFQQTNNNLDMAIDANGFFQLQLPDGTIGYTRDGSFQIDADGNVVSSNGYQLIGPINVPNNATSINVAQDGVVTANIAGQVAPQQLGQVLLSTFINPAGLAAKGQNYYTETAASGGPNETVPGQNGAGLINQGFVETSNVNVVEELVGLIQTQRAYEINSKAISTADQMLARLSQL